MKSAVPVHIDALYKVLLLRCTAVARFSRIPDRQHRLQTRNISRFPKAVLKAPLSLSALLPLSEAQKRTIYALSTPSGTAGVAVIRISGPEALNVWNSVVLRSSDKRTAPVPWKLERCHIVHPSTGQKLDDGLAVFFKGKKSFHSNFLYVKRDIEAPKSFTTEDVVELHIHSGRALISSVLTALSSLPYCRQAEPGEFTRRAFDGGRLDLTQVEGLNDLIHAETETQRRQALRVAEVRLLFLSPL